MTGGRKIRSIYSKEAGKKRNPLLSSLFAVFFIRTVSRCPRDSGRHNPPVRSVFPAQRPCAGEPYQDQGNHKTKYHRQDPGHAEL